MKKKNNTRKKLGGKYDNRKTRKHQKKYRNKTLKKMNQIVVVDGGKTKLFKPSDKNLKFLMNTPSYLLQGLYYTGKAGIDTASYGANQLGQVTSSGISYFTGNQPSPPLNAQNLQKHRGQYQNPNTESTVSDRSKSSNQSGKSSHAFIQPDLMRNMPPKKSNKSISFVPSSAADRQFISDTRLYVPGNKSFEKDRENVSRQYNIIKNTQ